MIWHCLKARRISLLLMVAALLLALSFVVKQQVESRHIAQVTQRVLQGISDDHARLHHLLDTVTGHEVIHVANISRSVLDDLPWPRRGWAIFYRHLPINLISPAMVWDYGLAMRGPCGAKSRLLMAMLRTAGYQARLNNLHDSHHVSQHAIIEARVGGAWIPLDPSYGIAFVKADGTLASTAEVAADRALFLSTVHAAEGISGIDYPEESYIYSGVFAVSLYDITFTVLRTLGLVSGPDEAARLYRNMAQWIPEEILTAHQGYPYIYDEPDLLLALLCVGVALMVGLWVAWRCRRESRHRQE